MTAIQQLIQEAEGGKEGDQAMDLRMEFRMHGKPDQVWKQVLSVKRRLEVIYGPCFTFMTLDNEELTDDTSDRNGLE